MEKINEILNGIKISIMVIIAITLLYFVWKDFFSQPQSEENTSPVVYRDTFRIIEMSPAIHIRDTIKKKVVVVIPDRADSILIYTLLAQQDTLLQIIDELGVESIARLDTIMPNTHDTLNIAYSEYDRNWDVYVGLAPRKINVETKFVYLPAPKIDRTWWDNPWVSGAIGIGTGLIVGVVIK